MTGKKVRKMDKNYAFIWDLDGTLLDSYGVIVSSMRLALEELGVRLSEREILEDAINQYEGTVFYVSPSVFWRKRSSGRRESPRKPFRSAIPGSAKMQS